MEKKGSGNSMIAPVSIIIPILNESEVLPELLLSLERQTLLPMEIIFVDAGSADGGTQIIKSWWKSKKWAGGECKILSCPGAFPGAGRNAGIESAQNEWIAFLDAGINPEPNWLNALLKYTEDNNVNAVFGVCRFFGEGTIGKAVCALSYGHGAIHPVLPGSLFRRSIFKEVGLFSPDLRAAEDIRWIGGYIRVYNKKNVCWSANASYRHFPNSLVSALKKWFIYGLFTVKAGVAGKQQAIYFIFTGLIVSCLLFNVMAGLVAVSGYIIARGTLDPMRRSKSMYWWKGNLFSFCIANFLGIGLDIAKVSGFLTGYLMKAEERPT